jgi:hypothetical protein
MNLSSTVALALPVSFHPAGKADANDPALDMREVQEELDELAHEVLRAHQDETPLPVAVRSSEYPTLRAFHQGLRDALFVEIPRELAPLVAPLTSSSSASLSSPQAQALAQLQHTLVEHAQVEPITASGDPARDAIANERAALQAALAELLVFESVRLRLLITTLSSDDYETVGGEEEDIDAIAWSEVDALLDVPAILDADIRPLSVMHAAATVAVARDAAERADLLRQTSEEFREQLRMRARLRAALRDLRLPESVLLENALAQLLGNEREELSTLQLDRPLALSGLSRQAMDQRVSRGRRALTRTPRKWPRRQRPALFDLLREPKADAA